MSSVVRLVVSDEDRKEVESLGARWNPFNQTWFIDTEDESFDFEPFYRWLPHVNFEDDLMDLDYIKADMFCILETLHTCWRCQKKITVYMFYLEYFADNREYKDKFFWMYYDYHPVLLEDVSYLNEGVLKRMRLATPNYYLDPKSKQYLNHCNHCHAKQFDSSLHSRIGQGFFPMDQNQANQIAIYHINQPFRAIGSIAYSSVLQQFEFKRILT